MRIYSDLELVSAHPEFPVTVMLYPFTGIYPEPFHDARAPMSTRFDTFCADHLAVELSTKEEADYFVFPFEWYGLEGYDSREKLLQDFFDEAAKFGRVGIVFAYGDAHVDLSRFSNALVFQSNLKKSAMRDCDRAMPAFVEDMGGPRSGTSRRSRAILRWAGQRVTPSLSFCGYANSAPERVAALRVFEDSKAVRTQFRSRNSYFGGAWDKKLAGFNYRKLRVVRREYVDSLVGSDYVLCARGWGNYSARFYEAMCCGKIPVFIDTDCVLPFEEAVDYDSAIFRISQADLEEADERLAEFDAALSDTEFLERQARCRQIWVDYLSPHGFFRNLQLACD